jgi:cyclopropane fatty-acyl-phospholipid synthase-like methyltransferase
MPKMTSASTRHFGKVFNEIAIDYDRHRPGYPDKLIEYACEIAELEIGDKVLELGCGSGQLTRSLVARGFHVTALEPGKQLIALAEQNAKGPGIAEFVNAKFEDAVLPKSHYKAVFSASAFHWIDPDVSWQKTAELLIPGGVFALISYFGLSEQSTSSDLELLLAALKKVSPKIAASWPHYYELDEIIDGVKARQENISDVWAWLGNYDLARNYVSNLFKDTQIAVVPNLIEQAADELIALFRTISVYSSLSDHQRDDLEHEYREIHKKIGRPIRSSNVTILITAKRSNIQSLKLQKLRGVY